MINFQAQNTKKDSMRIGYMVLGFLKSKVSCFSNLETEVKIVVVESSIRRRRDVKKPYKSMDIST